MAEQIALQVNLPEDQRFDNFIVGDNQQVVGHLQQSFSSDSPFLTYISGVPSSGKSHLLVAMCNEAVALNRSHFYLSLNVQHGLPAEILEGLEQVELVCIDDLECLQGDIQWQTALFDLINRIRENPGCHLVVSALTGPMGLQLELPDLASRLSWGINFRLNPLDEHDAMAALMVKAKLRGMHLPQDVAKFMLSRHERDMGSLVSLLDKLDTLTLQEQRKLTIPFVKQAIETA